MKKVLDIFRNAISNKIRPLLCFGLLLSLPMDAKTEIRIGRDPTWFPFDLREKNANVNLFINTLFEQINKKNGYTMTIVDVGPLNLWQGLQEKKYSAVLTVLTKEDEMEILLDFSEPIILLGPVLIVPISSEASDLSDFSDKLVGVLAYDGSIAIVQKYSSILMKKYDNMALALEDLSQGALDAVLMNVLEAKAIVSNLYADSLRIATGVLNSEGIRLATIKNQIPKLIPFFNKRLNELIETGSYEELVLYANIK